MYSGIWRGKVEGRKPIQDWEDLITYFKAVRWEAVRLVDLVQDRGKWRAVASTLTNPKTPSLKVGNFQTASQEGFCSCQLS
jgi:hypothetical protein